MFIRVSVDGYLGCFHLLALVNNDAMNIHVEVSVWVSIFSSLGFILRSGVSGLYGNCVTVLRDCQAGSPVSPPFFIPSTPVSEEEAIPPVKTISSTCAHSYFFVLSNVSTFSSFLFSVFLQSFLSRLLSFYI